MTLTMTDLFCGAGGSSTGGVSVPGVRVRMASNHWQKAVDVHNSNHPDADHLCADLSQVDPRYFPTTDLLWASPECTNHSQAKGRKRVSAEPDLFGETLPDEAAERSRATMWDVVRFTEHHAYRAIIVENVVDAARWVLFDSWLTAMQALGYNHHVVWLNSMHAQAHGLPAPQSRDRMYVVFWRKGDRRPDFESIQRPLAYCDRCDELVQALQTWKRVDRQPWGRYRSQYVYRCPKHSCRGNIVEPGWLPAAAAIDWTLHGTRIGDRAKPLADKTRKRIAAGIARYWRPVTVEAAGNTYDAADPKHPAHGRPDGYYRTRPIDEVLATLHTTASKALAIPVEGRDGKQARPLDEPLRTMTTRLETALVMTNNHKNRSRRVDEVLPTLTTGTTQALVQRPFIAELRGGGSTARPVDDPMATVTAAGNHHGLVTPYFGTAKEAKPTEEPVGTLTTVDRYALVMRNNTARGDQGQMSTPVHESLRTITTAGHQSLITPGDIEAAEAQVDDCLFRMLEPHEVAAGMAFPGDYLWDGTRRERVRMAGNAVTPPAARDLIACVVEALTGEEMAA